MTPPTRRAELPALPFARYRAVPRTVQAVQLAQAEDVPNLFAAGGSFHGEAGDWKVTYGANPDGTPNQAVVAAAVFAATYEHAAGDRYRKRPVTVEAARLAQPLDIVTTEGPSHGSPGDWLLVDAAGHCWFNDDAGFRRRYEPAD
jgi:hypothetical protein